jgi:hypothetical protein
MNVEDPNDPKFDLIRRALALKRHEIPPPRYFNELPGKILSRLAEPEAAEPVSFFEKIRQTFALRPMLATGAGMAAGVFVLGIVAITLLPTGNDLPANPVALVPAAADLDPLNTRLQSPPMNALAELNPASTNSSTDQPKSIFDSFKIETAPASAPGLPR